VDASVFVAAARAAEERHEDALEFFARADALGVPLICPTLVLPESAAAVARPTGNQPLANRVLAEFEALPRLHLIPLDYALARRAARIAIAQRLRGADSVYVAVAQACAATLVTWDQEMLERAGPAVRAVTPSQWVAEQKTKEEAGEE
jgi:predicted nucleic acid-binding protein